MIQHNQTTEWNAAQVDLLRRLRAEGRSASQIGKELHCSRNAVIGKVHRLGLCRPLSRPHTMRPRKLARADTISLVPPLVGGGKTIMELGYGDCRWPLGEPMELAEFYCGEVATLVSSYCAYHCRCAFR